MLLHNLRKVMTRAASCGGTEDTPRLIKSDSFNGKPQATALPGIHRISVRALTPSARR